MPRASVDDDKLNWAIWEALRTSGQTPGADAGSRITPTDIAQRAWEKLSAKGHLPPAQQSFGVVAMPMTGANWSTWNPDEKARILARLWEYAIQGILMLAHVNHTQQFEQNWYVLTPYGLTCIQSGEPSPYDPDGYLDNLQNAIGPIDATVSVYLKEALGSFHRNMFLASTVMLGAAAERAFMIMAEAFDPAMPPAARNISDLYKKFTTAINAKMAADVTFKRDIRVAAPRDDWQQRIESGFNIHRVARNEAGHPEIMRTISRLDAREYFVLFAEYLRVVSSMTKFFKP